jgi:SAM-dependent methyltransferase
VACGTGRLLIPYLRAGLDVDGCDISEDMVALCRERAEREGLSPSLYSQAMHELDLPRRYRTILVCGGIGGSREHDVEALERFYDHLEPGGLLVLDKEVPYANARHWRRWVKKERSALPEPWPAEGERRTGSDGAEYELRVRLADVDPLAQCVTFEIRATMSRDAKLVAEEQSVLKETMYFPNELRLMLEQAGFREVELRAGHTDAEPSADDDFVVLTARK